jgi:hypothetical protein
MGRRDDDFLDDERVDELVRRVLARSGEPAQVPPPPDLVARTARRLPADPPVVARRRAARRGAARLFLGAALLSVVALVALSGVLSAFGLQSPIAMLVGDGESGLSRVLLMLHLLAKPLLRSFGTVAGPLLVAGVLALAAASGAWWWLLRRTPGYTYAENTP